MRSREVEVAVREQEAQARLDASAHTSASHSKLQAEVTERELASAKMAGDLALQRHQLETDAQVWWVDLTGEGRV